MQSLFSRNDRVIYGSKVLRSLAGGTLEESGGVRDVRGVQHGVATEHAVDGPLLRSGGILARWEKAFAFLFAVGAGPINNPLRSKTPSQKQGGGGLSEGIQEGVREGF